LRHARADDGIGHGHDLRIDALRIGIMGAEIWIWLIFRSSLIPGMGTMAAMDPWTPWPRRRAKACSSWLYPFANAP
jgi:hypothetical protein